MPMIRQFCLALYMMSSVVVFANDSETGRIDAMIQEQDKSQSKKLPAAQNFVLGNTELRVDHPETSNGPVMKPVQTPSQATVTVRQPLNDNAALSMTNEFGSQKNDSLPFTNAENAYSLNRKEIWALDFSRASWNGRAYTETQGSGSNQQFFSSQQFAFGARTGTELPTGTGFAVEMRQENNKVSGGALGKNIYQTQLSQKIANLPFKFEFTPGLENETGLNGESLSQSTRFNNALLWQANTNTTVAFGSGLNSKNSPDATREETMLYYSQFDTAIQKDVTFSLRSDYQDLTRNSTGLSAYQEQKVNIQIGPRFRLPENFTASFDMRYGYTQQNGSGNTGTSEQALALSIQGRF